MKKCFAVFLLIFIHQSLLSQHYPDQVVMPNISGVKVYLQGDQTAYPIITLGSQEKIELHFDDLEARIKNYYFTFQLCNADWSPVNLSTFDYLSGFSTVRLNQYRVSSLAFTKYIHYQAVLPDRNCVPTKSGNYLLKVFLDGDTSKLAFTHRVLVVEKLADVGSQVVQPFNTNLFRTHQKVQFTVSKARLDVINPTQQIQAVLLQNYRWDNALTGLKPLFIRGNMMEFNTENQAVFAAGKEYRWLDMRSFRFQSDRIAKIDQGQNRTDVFVQADGERSQQRYLNYQDYNGFHFIESTDSNNPWWQGDYATVHFTFVPQDLLSYSNKKVYVVGQMNHYNLFDTAAMTFNSEKGVFEKTMFLKQGFYSYAYATKEAGRTEPASFALTEGNYWETENQYTILIYYRSLAGRHDELVGISNVNSLLSRKMGF